MNDEYKYMEKTKQYLKKIKTELVMSGYHDGWSVKWLNEKVLELESRLKKYKHKLND